MSEAGRLVKDLFTYIWTGPASADEPDLRRTRIREQFAAMLDFADADIPQGALDPFIDDVAAWMAQGVPETAARDTEPGNTGVL